MKRLIIIPFLLFYGIAFAAGGPPAMIYDVSGSISTHNSDTTAVHGIADTSKLNTSASVITDNAIVRGDGGAQGLQSSGVTVDDNNNITSSATLGANAVTIDATCTGWSAGGALADCGAGNTNGWCCNASASVQKIANGTTALTYDTGEADSVKAQIGFTTSGISGGGVTASIGGNSAPLVSTNTQSTFYTIFYNTNNLTFTPSATGLRVVIAGVTVKTITGGAVSPQGDFVTNAQIVNKFIGSPKYKNFYIDPYNSGNSEANPGFWFDGLNLKFGDYTRVVPVYIYGNMNWVGATGNALTWDGAKLQATYQTSFFGIVKAVEKFSTQYGTVPVLTSCGTAPAVTAGSSGVGGKITFGTSAGTPSACTLTWGVAFTNTPACTVTVVGAVDGYLRVSAESNTAMTVTANGSVDLSGTSFNYHCVGLGE